MKFLNPWMLTGLLLAAIPLLVHFLNRSRYRREPFGAMLFLQAAIRVRARKLRFRQALLLAVRVAFFAALALALARPTQMPGRGGDTAAGGGEEQPTTHMLIVDDSFSMQRLLGQELLFDKAREYALRIVDDMRPGDNMQIIRAGRKPIPLFHEPIFDRTFLYRTIRDMVPGNDSFNLPRALEQAFWSLEDSRLPRRRIYVLTDGQAVGWRLEERQEWLEVGGHRKVLKVDPVLYALNLGAAAERPWNLAVTGLEMQSPLADTFRPVSFDAALSNFSEQARTVRVQFRVDGELRAVRDVTLAPGTQTVTFDHFFTTAGAHHVAVELPRDDLPVDDVRYLAVHVMRRVPVLVLTLGGRAPGLGDGDDAEGEEESGGCLVKLALESSGNAGDEQLFQVTNRSITEADILDAGLLDRFRVVVMVNVVSLPANFVFLLERFVERGGGLLLSCGGAAKATGLGNSLYKDGKGIMPAELREIVAYDNVFFTPRLMESQAGFLLDIRNIDSASSVLGGVRVAKYWNCQAAPEAGVLGWFDQAPFLVYKNYGRGRTVFWSTSLDLSWTNLPATQDYLPLLQSLVLTLAAQVQPPVSLNSGDLILYSSRHPIVGEGDAGSSDAPAATVPLELELTGEVVLPNGSSEPMLLRHQGDGWSGTWSDTGAPGIYEVKAASLPSRYFAVRLAPGESDPGQVSAGQLKALQDVCEITMISDMAQLKAAMAGETGVREWWREFLLFALLFLCADLVLSWRFST